MLAEIKHKLMRTETLLDILRRCYTENRNNFQQAFIQQVLGMIVLTRYNNKTYRISDVLFDLSPSSTFDTRDGPVSYVDYYKAVNTLPFLNFFFFLLIKIQQTLINVFNIVHRNISCQSQM